eukprot:7308190-Pyramimonas_sp.AAC.1
MCSAQVGGQRDSACNGKVRCHRMPRGSPGTRRVEAMATARPPEASMRGWRACQEAAPVAAEVVGGLSSGFPGAHRK